MIRRNILSLAACAFLASAAANAGPATVSPALAACSKALVETIAKAETLPRYSVKAPSAPMDSITDPNSFTVLAHSKSSNKLLAKASCKATPAGEIVSFKSIPLRS